jgi:glycine/betaine/sarcosine/D-proline reductase family selenoprotein B
MAAAIERQGFPVVNITAVPTVSSMIGVTRVLRGESVANLLGNIEISSVQEKMLRRRYVLRALEILRMELKEKQVFTLEGTE